MLIGVIVFSSIHVTASNTKNLSFQHQPTRALPYGSTSTYKGPSLWISQPTRALPYGSSSIAALMEG